MILNQVVTQVKQWQALGLRVALVTGVFDLLHIEHLRFLTKAQSAGDKLVVGVETDARVQAIKGPNRPINSQAIRLEQLQALKPVDLPFLLPKKFSTQTAWVDFMTKLKPDLYAVSSHTSYLKNKQAICDQLGIQFKVVHRFNPAISSTKLLAQLLAAD